MQHLYSLEEEHYYKKISEMTEELYLFQAVILSFRDERKLFSVNPEHSPCNFLWHLEDLQASHCL